MKTHQISCVEIFIYLFFKWQVMLRAATSVSEEWIIAWSEACTDWSASAVSNMLHNHWLIHNCVAPNISSYSCIFMYSADIITCCLITLLIRARQHGFNVILLCEHIGSISLYGCHGWFVGSPLWSKISQELLDCHDILYIHGPQRTNHPDYADPLFFFYWNNLKFYMDCHELWIMHSWLNCKEM